MDYSSKLQVPKCSISANSFHICDQEEVSRGAALRLRLRLPRRFSPTAGDGETHQVHSDTAGLDDDATPRRTEIAGNIVGARFTDRVGQAGDRGAGVCSLIDLLKGIPTPAWC